MVRVNGEPFLYYQLKYFSENGFKEFILCTGHLSNIIESYMKNIKDLNINYKISREKVKIGTGGAIINALDFIKDDFLVVNGDNLFLGDLNNFILFYRKLNTKALILLRKVQSKGNLVFNKKNNTISYYNKKANLKFEDAGLKIFSKNIFSRYSKNKFFSLENNIYLDLINENKLFGMQTNDKIIDIGDHLNLKNSINFFKKSNNAIR